MSHKIPTLIIATMTSLVACLPDETTPDPPPLPPHECSCRCGDADPMAPSWNCRPAWMLTETATTCAGCGEIGESLWVCPDETVPPACSWVGPSGYLDASVYCCSCLADPTPAVPSR